MVEAVVELARRHDGYAGRDKGAFGAWLVGSLRTGCDGYCLHAPLERHDARTRLLLGRVRELGRRLDPGDVPAGGIVHRDLHHRNALWGGGRVSAIVDWEDSLPGDRAFDLVTLAFGLDAARTTPEVRELPWQAAAATGPEVSGRTRRTWRSAKSPGRSAIAAPPTSSAGSRSRSERSIA